MIFEKDQEKLEHIYKCFSDKLKTIAEEAIGEVITDFLPYAQDDLDSNVYHRSQDVLKAYLGNDDVPEWITKDITLREINSKEFRKKVYEENEDLITNDIIKDLKDEIKSLESKIEFYEGSVRF